MRHKSNQQLIEAIEETFVQQFEEEREEDRAEVHSQMTKIQNENKRTFNAKRKEVRTN